MSSVNSLTENSRLGCTSPITVLSAISEGHLGPRRVAQFGGVLGVTLAVYQHQRIPLVILDDVGDTAEILLPFLLSSQSVLLSGWYEADRDVVHSALVKHH